MKDWLELTQRVLETVGAANQRLQGGKPSTAPDFYKELNSKRIDVEKIKAAYEAGRLSPEVQGAEEATFQALVAELERQSTGIGSKEPSALVGNLNRYLSAFLGAGPHGSGSGEPYAESSYAQEEQGPEEQEEIAEESFDPDTHGGGEGEP